MTHAAARLWSGLFADSVGEGRGLVLWFFGPPNAAGRNPKRSAWTSSVEGAVAALAAPEVQGWKTYFHVALHDFAAARAEAAVKDQQRHAVEVRKAEREGRAAPRQRPPRTDPARIRGCAVSARVLGGVWADFDVAGPDHTKAGLPQTREEILAKLATCPLPPSFLIHTGGGGVQAYWAFREPLEVGDHELARAQAYGLVKGWELFLRDGLGLLPDPTADLARLLRVPGVEDAARGKMVELAGESGKAYNPAELREFAIDTGPLFARERTPSSAHPQRVLDAGGLRLDPDAQPHWPKVSALLGLDARFTLTWKRQRPELKSQSEYDLSLAAQLLPLGFTEQEVVDALIYHRREAGEKEKLRPEYYAATLGRVRTDGRAEDAYRRLDEASSSGLPVAPPEPVPAPASRTVLAPTPAPPPPLDPRETTLAALRDALGVDLRAIIKHPVDGGSIYVVVIGTQRHTLGGIAELLEAARFRSRLADIAEVAVRPYKPAQWAPLAKLMLRVLEHETIGTESDPAANMADLLVTYLDMKLASVPEGEFGTERRLVSGERQPFVDAKVWQPAIFLLEFGGWLRLRMGADYSQKRLAQLLRWAGATPKVYAARKAEDDEAGDARTTTSAWLVPPSIYPLPPRRARQELDGG
jgi:hypothetical protein